MSNLIHPTAVVEEGAELAADVSVGAFRLSGKVKIGKGSVVHSHAVINGNTTIGENNHIFQFCSIGEVPQDLTYKGEDTRVVIGDNNTFREYVSIHRGTLKENQLTQIGSHSLFMAMSMLVMTSILAIIVFLLILSISQVMLNVAIE